MGPVPEALSVCFRSDGPPSRKSVSTMATLIWHPNIGHANVAGRAKSVAHGDAQTEHLDKFEAEVVRALQQADGDGDGMLVRHYHSPDPHANPNTKPLPSGDGMLVRHYHSPDPHANPPKEADGDGDAECVHAVWLCGWAEGFACARCVGCGAGLRVGVCARCGLCG
eukprot:1870692-Prymnesium_polylepis.1